MRYKIISTLIVIAILSVIVVTCCSMTATQIDEQIENNDDKIVTLSAMKEEIHNLAEDLRSLGYCDDDVELQYCSNIWWSLHNNKMSVEQANEEYKALKEQLPKEEFLGNFDSTAYCSSCDDYSWGGKTARGVYPEVDVTIAVDPRVIPLGSRVHIFDAKTGNDLGYRIAQDTGGAIKGNKLDMYVSNSQECNNWGHRSLLVYIVLE